MKIFELVSEGPCTVSSLAMRTGQHENTVREHLDALVDMNLASRYQSAEHSRGRPAWFYRARDRSENFDVADYGGLASALAGSISRSSANPKMDAIEAGMAWAPELAKLSMVDQSGASKKIGKSNSVAIRRKTTSLLKQLGFEPKQNAEITRVRLTRCPLLDAARQNPEIICNVHLGLIRGFLAEFGAEPSTLKLAQLTPFSEVGACLLKL